MRGRCEVAPFHRRDRLKAGLHAPYVVPPSGGSGLEWLKTGVPRLLLLLLTLLATLSAHAQWQTQTITLKPGWNAVYLHVDASHLVVNEDVPVPIEEIWLWKPVFSPDRFIDNPQQPVSGNDWVNWDRRTEVADTLTSLIGNAAYLVRNGDTVDYVWSVKGKPVPPRYTWTSKGVNLLGFSTPPQNAPLFSNFFSPVPRLVSEGEFYRYDDGDGDLSPSPFKALFNTVRVNRGQAYWIRHANQFNRYFGAFEATLQNSSGVNFRDFIDQYTIRLRNQTTSEVTVTLDLLDSESAPTGQTAIAGKPPLLRRGALSAQNLTYAFTTFDSAQTVTLKPRGEVGSEAEVVLGINRLAMNGNAGDLFAGILRLTDSLGYTQIDLPVSANQASGGATFASGLWVGNAVVNQVRHYLNNYKRDADDRLVTAEAETNGLLLEMRMDEGSGTIIKNSAPGTALTLGTLVNSPVWSANGPPTDDPQGAVEFTPGAPQYADLGEGVALGNTFTEEAWLFPLLQDGAMRGFLGFETNPNSRAPSLYVSGTAIRVAYTSAAGPFEAFITPVPPLPVGAWSHVAITLNGSELRLYVNGVLSAVRGAPLPVSPAIPVKWIGRVDPVFQGSNFFPGAMAQVRLWNVARTQEQIQSSMARSQLKSTFGNYVISASDTSLGDVARPFNLRLIVHKSADEARLLQRIFHGLNLGGNQVLSKTEDALDPNRLGSARRISAVELPFTSGNDGWPFSGQFAQGQTIVAQVDLAYDDYQSNPFLHSYHPDHDDLNPTFTAVESRGVESYDIERRITLVIAPPAQDFKSVIAAGNEITGQYSEEITLKGRGTESRRIDTAGSFVLRRISDIATLTAAP